MLLLPTSIRSIARISGIAFSVRLGCAKHTLGVDVIIRCFLLSLLMVLALDDSWAANVSSERKYGGKIFVEGVIARGDFEKIRDEIVKRGEYFSIIELNSSGGDLREAMAIGEMVYATRARVSVKANGICASACFFIWINGAKRFAFGYSERNESVAGVPPLGVIGLHRPYLVSPDNTAASVQRQVDAMAFVSNYLKYKMVPQSYIEIMMSHSSRDIYWLERKEISRLGSTPAELEELYIARCGNASDRVLDEAIRASRAGQPAKARELRLKFEDTSTCESEIDRHAIREGIEKLKAGWRPEIAFK